MSSLTEDMQSICPEDEHGVGSEVECDVIMKAELKFLDKRRSEKGRTYYTETKDEETPEQTDWWQTYALCLTRHMSKDGTKVERTSLQVNSEHLKMVLREVVKDYPGISFDTSAISIDAPYHVLFHYRKELIKAGERLSKDSDSALHLDLLMDFINEAMGEDVAQYENLVEQGLINYDLLWTIFKPGSIVFSPMLGQLRALKVHSYQYMTGQRPCLNVTTSYIDFDGEDFGTRSITRSIPPFLGDFPINALPTVPASFHEREDAVRAELLARGAKFERYAGMNFASYAGVGLDMENPCQIKRVSVDGRVVIDCKTFHRINADMSFDVTPFPNDQGIAQADGMRFNGNGDHEPTKVDLTSDQLLLASGLVRGFCFAEKRWLDFYVEKLVPIQWDERCFDQLVLAVSHKNIVRALVSDHMQTTDSFDDIVEGKGKGLIMVLHGPPGVGKTLTAECVSEYVKKPLYIVSSGDLGTNSATLDERLTRILDMAATWRVVLLIDEADVFLEARSQHDLERNALVSIFLRVLEYYQGIMFLTTNRVDTFDDAFKSRIHVPLKYSDLTTASRKTIWKNFLSKVEEGVEVDDSGYDFLSKAHMNGRQIKNVIRTAKSLSHYDQKKLDLDMLQQVINIQLEFEQDFNGKISDVLPVPLWSGDLNNDVNGVH